LFSDGLFHFASADADFQVLHISNLAHGVLNLGCAFSPTSGSLIAFRFLCMYFAYLIYCIIELLY
jgi:hypothetical protein